MENFRSRRMGMLLYPDDVTHVQAIELIKAYDYGMILHDKDTDDDGVIKKAHNHVVVKFKNAQWASAIAKELGISQNYIQNIRSEESALEYLIHYNDSDKYQYDVDSVQGNLKLKLKEYINKNDITEGERVLVLLKYIDEQNKYITTKDFARYCAENGYWDIFRRSAAIYLNIIKEHNEKYQSQKHDDN